MHPMQGQKGKRESGKTDIVKELVPKQLITATTKITAQNFEKIELKHAPRSLSPRISPIFSTFTRKGPPFYITINIRNEPISSFLDSGSTRTYVVPKAA